MISVNQWIPIICYFEFKLICMKVVLLVVIPIYLQSLERYSQTNLHIPSLSLFIPGGQRWSFQ
jgi:hypothetical protein